VRGLSGRRRGQLFWRAFATRARIADTSGLSDRTRPPLWSCGPYTRAREARKKFTEPVALLSTQPADLPLPRTALRRSFNLLALRARCEQEPTHARPEGQDSPAPDYRTLRRFSTEPLMNMHRRALHVSDPCQIRVTTVDGRRSRRSKASAQPSPPDLGRLMEIHTELNLQAGGHGWRRLAALSAEAATQRGLS
jgi:hypothetical protein